MNNIILSGPDGTGKSTILKALQDNYNSKGISSNQIWLRFNHYFSRLINLIGRISGKSYYNKYEWGKIGYHDYEGIIGFFYVIFIFIDHVIFLIFFKSNYLKKNQFYLIDRYIVDTMADLIVDTGRKNLVYFLFGPLLKRELILSHFFILECDKENVFKRRPDILHDKKYNYKIKAFNEISSKYNIVKIDTGRNSVIETVNLIISQTVK